MEHERILVIAAHPDDTEFFTAGSAAKWVRAGRRVEYCISTSGEKGFTGEAGRALSTEERWAIREEEQRAAARIVGVETLTFLRHVDGELENTPALRRDLVRVIRRARPGLVIAEDPAMSAYDSFYGYHSDHRVIAQAVFDALYPAAGNENYFPELIEEEGLAPFSPKEAYFGHAFHGANVWEDITETFDLKIRALACHKSQIEDIDELTPILRDWAKRAGEGEGLACAEAFRSLKVPQ
ncbi:MAG: PIG-L deacetylase family protein [bacterium]